MTEQGQGSCGSNCGCGTPSRAPASPESKLLPLSQKPPTSKISHAIEQVNLAGGIFIMGDSSGDENQGDGETPQHSVAISPFSIDATSVTNAAFRVFVQETGYVTEAEKFGHSAVFHLAVEPGAKVIEPAAGTPWWLWVEGAYWNRPFGVTNLTSDMEDHPVVHISWNDADAYCQWAGRRLPTEAEWEFAARGGLSEKKYPWGDQEPDFDGQWRTNIWQGVFPTQNTLDDGFLTTAPVRTFQPNGYGLWQMVGNVWEWCSDWYSPNTYTVELRRDPKGPATGASKVLRGGSYLCHISYCNRYRNSARSQNTIDSSMGNAGFRTVLAEGAE